MTRKLSSKPLRWSDGSGPRANTISEQFEDSLLDEPGTYVLYPRY